MFIRSEDPGTPAKSIAGRCRRGNQNNYMMIQYRLGKNKALKNVLMYRFSAIKIILLILFRVSLGPARPRTLPAAQPLHPEGAGSRRQPERRPQGSAWQRVKGRQGRRPGERRCHGAGGGGGGGEWCQDSNIIYLP